MYYYGNGCKSYSSVENNAAIDSSYHTDGNIVAKLDYVGGIAGDYYGKISNSYNSGKILGTRYVGGVAGQGYSIVKSYADGAVDGSACYVGGVAGRITGSVNYSYHIGGTVKGDCNIGGVVGYGANMVTKSYAEGDVTGSGTYVGGIAGYAEGGVDSVYHINGNVSGKSYVGGVIGFTSSVKNSYSKGNVDGNENYIGGLVGWTYSVVKSFVDGSVKTNGNNVGGLAGYVRNTIESSYHIGGNVYGGSYVGGLVGVDSSSIVSSYSEGDVIGTGNYIGGLVGNSYRTSISNSYVRGNVEGLEFVGGIAGCAGKKDYIGEIAHSYHTGGSVQGTSYVGGLAGSDSVPVSNSYSKGDVIGSENYVGGLLGYMNSSIKNSFAKGEVKSNLNYVGGIAGYTASSVDSSYHLEGDVRGKSYVGGLIGQAVYSIANSYFEGNVTGSGNYVGGIVGRGNAISNGYVKGNVVADLNNVGGLAGYSTGLISNSYANVSVSGLDSVGGVAGRGGKIKNTYAIAPYVKGRNSVGGLVGRASDSIRTSYFEGDSVIGIYQVGGLIGYAAKVVDSSYSTANVKGDDNVGGLIGSAYGDVSNSYALGNVDGDVDNSSAGNDNLGGLVGYQYSGSVTKSMALGNITGTTKLGGLVGRFDGTSISNSYANGNVTGDYYGDPADEVGNYYIGGLVGYAKGSLDNTYASGVVKGMEEDPVYTGCMVGYVNGSLSVIKSYYDKSKCSLGIDGGEETVTLTGSPDKTTAEMHMQSTFEDWNFIDTWKIMDDTYPFLQIYSNSLTNAVVQTASLEGYKYDGTAKTPLVLSVKLFGETLEYETEYTIAYENNVNAGTAHINVCGVKPYGGCKVVDFEIAAIPVEPTIAAIENMTYTGRALIPEINVYNGEALLATTDYTVEYRDNVNAGTATVVVTIKGNFSGTASKTFTIEKATPIVTKIPTANDIVLGETLAKSELTDGLANVEGSFAWKNGEVKPTLENEGYAVVFTPTDEQNYKVSEEIIVPIKVLDMVYVVLRAEKTTIDSSAIVKGGKYTIPELPNRTGYDLDGVYNGAEKIGVAGSEITVSENMVIEAKYVPKKYFIVFWNGITKLQSGEVEYGSLPEYTGEIPSRTKTTQYTYTFKGWDPDVVMVSESAMYWAVFDSLVNKYVVTFKNGDEVLQSSEVEYGAVPTAPKVTLPENTAQYTYTFGGWDKTIVAVTGTATYTAVINKTLNEYSVSFRDYNGDILKDSMSYAYGTKASDISKPSNPTRTSTAQFAYSFKDWNPTVSDVTEDIVYVAEYDSTVRSYTISFVNGSVTLQSDVLEYGAMPSYEGEVPTKAASTKYTYTFANWSPTITSVTGAATYKAVFDSVQIVDSSSSAMVSSSSSSKITSSSSKSLSSSSIACSSSSSKIVSSSSTIRSSSSVKSSSSTAKSSSSKGNVPIAMQNEVPHFSVSVGFRNVQIAGAKVGSAYALLDLQGRILQKGRVESANFNIAVPQSGSYLVRINKQTKRVDVK